MCRGWLGGCTVVWTVSMWIFRSLVFLKHNLHLSHLTVCSTGVEGEDLTTELNVGTTGAVVAGAGAGVGAGVGA